MTAPSRPNTGYRPTLRCTLLIGLLVFQLPAIVIADTGNSSNLISNNPFVPAQAKSNTIIKNPTRPTRTPSNNTTKKTTGVLSKYLQFKSVAIINNKKYFSVFNRRTNKSFWLPENQSIESFRVTSYDPATQSITISDGINSEQITIITPDEKPINVIATPIKSTETNQLVQPTTQQNNQEQKRQPIPRRRVVSVKTKQ